MKKGRIGVSCLFSLIGFSIIVCCVFMTTDDDTGMVGVVGLTVKEVEVATMSEEEGVSNQTEDYGRIGVERGNCMAYIQLTYTPRLSRGRGFEPHCVRPIFPVTLVPVTLQINF